jgi:hypothetical protein
MDRITDGRGQALETGTPVRVGGSVGGGSHLSLSSAADIRRFRLTHALQAIENALILLDTSPAEGVEISALERVRDDLSVVLRTIGAAR